MTDDILRYSAFGCRYRLKLSQVIYFSSHDAYKFLATICNQETHEKSLQTLEHIFKYMEEAYHKQIEKEIHAQRFTIALKRLEKNMYRVRAMQDLMIEEIHSCRIITEAEIQRRCRAYFRDAHNTALSCLLNYYGINFPVFSDMYMKGGTAISMLYALDHNLFDMEMIEKRRRYEID